MAGSSTVDGKCKHLSKNILQMKFMQPELEKARRGQVVGDGAESSEHWEVKGLAPQLSSVSVFPDEGNASITAKHKLSGRRSFGNFNPVIEVCSTPIPVNFLLISFFSCSKKKIEASKKPKPKPAAKSSEKAKRVRETPVDKDTVDVSPAEMAAQHKQRLSLKKQRKG